MVPLTPGQVADGHGRVGRVWDKIEIVAGGMYSALLRYTHSLSLSLSLSLSQCLVGRLLQLMVISTFVCFSSAYLWIS